MACTNLSMFTIFTMAPRKQIYPKDSLSEICASSSLLIVEEDANALDPLLWNCDHGSQEVSNQ